MGWIEQLGEVDTDGVEPMRSVMPLPAHWRADEVTDGGRPDADPAQRAQRARRLLRGARRWSNERAHRSHAGGRARRPARAQVLRAELARAHIAAIERQRGLNAFITETPERALAMASQSDARLAQGEGGLLEGVPLAIKDLFCTEGVLTTAGSHILDGFVPPYESTVSRKLWEAGAVCLGKTNLDEFAMGSSNMTVLLRRRPQSLDPAGRERRPGAGRQLGRLGRGGGGPALPGCHRHRYRRLDPPAGRLLRHHRHQADLWPLLALGHRRLRELARPGRPDGAHGRGLRPDAAGDGRLRPDGQHLGRHAGAGLVGHAQPATCAACASASPRNIRCRACRPRSTAIWRQGARVAEGAGCGAGRGLAAAHQIRAADLLHHRPGRGLLEPRPLRRHALRPAGRGQEPGRDLHEDPRRGLRRRGPAARPDRHLRALGRLLRRLLSQGAEGPPPHRRGLRAGVRRRSTRSSRRRHPRARSAPARRWTIRSRCTSTTCSP